MVRHLALFDETAYDSVLINGMVLGADGRKMSKSLGNFVSSPEVFDKYGSDAPRQWAAAGGGTGTDIPFRWEDVEYGWRFMRKIWNACRFAGIRLQDYEPEKKVEPELIDKWIISKLEGVVEKITNSMENCDFMNATEASRNFVWHVFCDHWLEAAKTRLYGEGGPKHSAQQTMYYVIPRMLKLLAPIMPHLTEEIYRTMFDETSIHVSKWPEYNASLIDEESETAGDIIITTISEIRREKNRKGISLNKEVSKVTLFCKNDDAEILRLGLKDIMDTLKVFEVEIVAGKGGSNFKDYPEIGFEMRL
jgi:valyl-tRNA synthetase